MQELLKMGNRRWYRWIWVEKTMKRMFF